MHPGALLHNTVLKFFIGLLVGSAQSSAFAAHRWANPVEIYCKSQVGGRNREPFSFKLMPGNFARLFNSEDLHVSLWVSGPSRKLILVSGTTLKELFEAEENLNYIGRDHVRGEFDSLRYGKIVISCSLRAP